jgi:acylphosphatase
MAKRLIIKGRVQGVGYRVSFAETAIALGLAGWVRNRRDGSVEACVQGDDDAITAVVSWARRGPPAARVSDVVVTESEEPTPENKQFEILDTR